MESIENTLNMVWQKYNKLRFYFSPKYNFCNKLKKLLEYKKVYLDDFEIQGITNLLFDKSVFNGSKCKNQIALVIWNINEMIRRIVLSHPILGTIELQKQTITKLIINNGGNIFEISSDNSIFFFHSYHQMVLCFTNIFLNQPWLRKEINFNDLATLYFISKSDSNEKSNENNPIIDFNPIPFSSLYIDNNNNNNNNSNNNHNNNNNNNHTTNNNDNNSKNGNFKNIENENNNKNNNDDGSGDSVNEN